MPTEKILISNRLRLDIMERRKNIGISSYELSEKIGNGHSKFWLQNIESGKTKKIAKDDLVKIYMILTGSDEPEAAISCLERILNQNIGNNIRPWYELIDISNEFSEIYEEDDLMDTLDQLLDDQLVPKIRDVIFGMSTNQKQAALTALQHLYYSLYKNQDLAFALIGIPVYGTENFDETEHITALNDLLGVYSKFNDLAIKNDSIRRIHELQKTDEYLQSLFYEWIHEALDNFSKIISDLYDEIHKKSPNIYLFMQNFIKDVSFMIERGQPNVLKHYLKSWQISTGKDFVIHIEDCIKWFIGFQNRYDLPFIYNVVDKNKLNEIYDYLNKYGNIKPIF